MVLRASLRRLKQTVNQRLNSQTTPHISPSRASYGVSIVGIGEKTDRLITVPALYICIQPIFQAMWTRPGCGLVPYLSGLWRHRDNIIMNAPVLCQRSNNKEQESTNHTNLVRIDNTTTIKQRTTKPGTYLFACMSLKNTDLIHKLHAVPWEPGWSNY